MVNAYEQNVDLWGLISLRRPERACANALWNVAKERTGILRVMVV
jgi:hypothetical protein